MRFTRTLMLSMLMLLGIATVVTAQTIDTIIIGESKDSAVTETTPAPSFFFDASANQVITVQVTALTQTLSPVLLVADSQNQMIDTFSAILGEPIVGGTVTIPADGRYFVQVQGSNGSRGAFTLVLLEGDIPINAPTGEPETTSEVVPVEAPSADRLQAGDRIQSILDSVTIQQQFSFDTAASSLMVQVQGGGIDTGFSVTLTSTESGTVIGSYQAPVEAGAFVVPSASGIYTLTVQHLESDPPQPFLIGLSEYLFGEPLDATLEAPEPTPTPQPTDPPTPIPTPTALSPEEVDLLLNWTDSSLMMTNVSGATLNIEMVAFAGDGRQVDRNQWLRLNPNLVLTSLPPNACAGFRPLAYGDAPPLGLGCNDLAAWWSAEIVYFWGGSEFDVLYNGVTIATCMTTEGQCGVDIPDA